MLDNLLYLLGGFLAGGIFLLFDQVFPALRGNLGEFEWIPRPSRVLAVWAAAFIAACYFGVALGPNQIEVYGQPLATMFAGVSAICAASIAYAAATSKTRHDRYVDALDRWEKKLNLMLMTEQTARVIGALAVEARTILEWANKKTPAERCDTSIPLPPQVKVIWEQLGALDSCIIENIQLISRSIEMNNTLCRLDPDNDEIKNKLKLIGEIAEYAKTTYSLLEEQIPIHQKAKPIPGTF